MTRSSLSNTPMQARAGSKAPATREIVSDRWCQQGLRPQDGLVTDADLVAAALGGDRAAYGALVERHQRSVFAVALAVGLDASASEDVAQEAFVCAWNKLHALRDRAAYRAWVCSIARRLALHALKKRKEAPLGEESAPDPERGPEAELAQRQEAELVRALLEGLSPKLREAMILYYIEERSAEQVAVALNIAVNTVEQRISRARRQLQSHVEALLEQHFTRKAAAVTVAAMVLSRIETAGASVHPGRTTGATSLTGASWLLGLALLAAAFVGAGVRELVMHDARGSNPVDAATGVAVAAPPRPDAVASATVAPGGWLDLQEQRARARASEEDVASILELTQSQWGRTGVAFDGGPLTGPRILRNVSDDPLTAVDESTFRRTIAGRVVDAQGRGVRVAVIASYMPLWITPGGVEGDVGVTSDDSGSFSIEVEHGAVSLIAVRSSDAWSRALRVPLGLDDVRDVRLELSSPGRVSGRYSERGVPATAAVHIDAADGTFWFRADDAGRQDGSFGELLVPPGAFIIEAGPPAAFREDDVEAGRAKKAGSVGPGESVFFALDVAAGGLVAVELRTHAEPAAAAVEIEPALLDEMAEDIIATDSMALVSVRSGAFQIHSEPEYEGMRDAEGKSYVAYANATAPLVEFDDVPAGDITVCGEYDGLVTCTVQRVQPEASVTQVVLDFTGDSGGYVFARDGKMR